MKLPVSVLTKHQTKTFEAFNVTVNTEWGPQEYRRVKATVRYDDECGNGHNSFSITGKAWEANNRRDCDTCGCIHDIIEQAFPELAPFIKWHLTSSDGPMYYIANTMYHARTCSHKGKQVGDPVKFETRLAFEGCPFTFEEKEEGFFDFLEAHRGGVFKLKTVAYDGKDTYSFSPNYTIEGFTPVKQSTSGEWYDTLFNNRREACEFIDALNTMPYLFAATATEYATAVTPDIEAARRCAVWPDATLEQLQSKEALEDRLLSLMEAFKADMELLGFTY